MKSVYLVLDMQNDLVSEDGLGRFCTVTTSDAMDFSA